MFRYSFQVKADREPISDSVMVSCCDYKVENAGRTTEEPEHSKDYCPSQTFDGPCAMGQISLDKCRDDLSPPDLGPPQLIPFHDDSGSLSSCIRMGIDASPPPPSLHGHSVTSTMSSPLSWMPVSSNGNDHDYSSILSTYPSPPHLSPQVEPYTKDVHLEEANYGASEMYFNSFVNISQVWKSVHILFSR